MAMSMNPADVRNPELNAPDLLELHSRALEITGRDNHTSGSILFSAFCAIKG